MSIERIQRRRTRWVKLRANYEDYLREEIDSNDGVIQLEHRLHARRVQKASGAWEDELRITTGVVQQGIRGEYLVEPGAEKIITGDGPIVGVVFNNAAYKIK